MKNLENELVPQGPVPPESRDLWLSEALRGIYRAIQKSAIYPSGHPSIPEAVEKAAASLRVALDERPQLMIRVANDFLSEGDKRLGSPADGLRSLAQLLYQLDIGAVEIRGGLQPAALEGLAKLLGRARRERLRGAALARELERGGQQQVVLHPIDYRLLRFGDGAQSDPGDDALGWLSCTLSDNASSDVDDTLSKLASKITESIERNEGAGLGALRQQLQETIADCRGFTDERRAQTRRRVAGFINGLDGNLRRDLLRIDVGNPRAALDILGEVGSDLPLPEVLEALHDLDQAGARIPDEVLALLSKLARSAPSVGTTTPIDRVCARWNAQPSPGSGSADTRQALAELLHRRADADYNPESYRRILEDLSTTTFEGEARISAIRYRDPSDPEDVRRHAAELAVQLLARSSEEVHGVAILGYLRNAAGFLVDVGDLGTLHEASLTVRAHSALQGESDATRRAARGLLDEFSRPERIAKILELVRERNEATEEALGLLALGGSLALDLVLDELAATPMAPTAEAFRRFACERGGHALLQLLDARSTKGRSAIEPFFAIARELPTIEAIPLLERLAESNDDRVRAEALALLCEIDSRAGSPERHLRRALGDTHLPILTMAIDRLDRLGSPEAAELLAEYLEFGISGVAPRDSISTRAAASLLELGDAGRDRLAVSLQRLTRSVRIDRARQARMIAACLASAIQTPEVRKALKDWKYSLGRLVGLFGRGWGRLTPGDAS